MINKLPTIGFIVLAGCQTMQMSESAIDAANPDALPTKTVTNFSDAISCMDRMLGKAKIKGIMVTADNIPDATGKIKGGTKEMLITTLSSMAATSEAIDFISYGSDLGGIGNLTQFNSANKAERPDFFIRGAITQADKNVQQEQQGGGLDVGFANASLYQDSGADLISLDLNVGLVRNLKIAPGINSRNTIVVGRKGQSGEIGATIQKLGVMYSVNMMEAEGSHQALRTLVELGLVEIVGKMTKLPYWRCLGTQADTTYMASKTPDLSQDSIVYKELKKVGKLNYRSEYDKPALLAKTVDIWGAQRHLSKLGYRQNDPTGTFDRKTAKQVKMFQSDIGIPVTGIIDLETYNFLIQESTATATPNEINNTNSPQKSEDDGKSRFN